MDNLISIIVPVYNVEKYLPRCIESIMNQNYRSLQIILVDDGSTDGSGKLCDYYSELDERITVIHKGNGGLSSARNAGLDKAIGGFIGFVDSDDYIEPDMYEKMLRRMEKYSADICICSSYDEKETGERSVHITYKEEIVMNSEQALEKINPFYDFGVAAWSKLCRAALFNGMRFPVGRTCEDYYVTPYLFAESNIIVYLPLPLYHYIQREGSITKNRDSFNGAMQAAQFFSDFFTTKYPNIDYVGKMMLVFSQISYINWHIKYGKAIPPEIKIQAASISRKNLSSILKNRNIKLLKKLQVIVFCSDLDLYIWFFKRLKHID